MDNASRLTGHLLIAMPTMQDPNFQQTVTYVCEHSEHGALGLVINRPMEMDLGEVFEQLELERFDTPLSNLPVLRGGPVQLERGFVLHDAPDAWESTMQVTPSIRVTTSPDILSSMAAGDGPDRALIALGYSGWGAGQLEQEIFSNAWLSVPATPRILFDTPFSERWREAAGLLGVDLATISGDAGHA